MDDIKYYSVVHVEKYAESICCDNGCIHTTYQPIQGLVKIVGIDGKEIAPLYVRCINSNDFYLPSCSCVSIVYLIEKYEQSVSDVMNKLKNIGA